MTLRIPEIPGLPFGRPEPPKTAPEPVKSDVPVQEEIYAHPMLTEAKEALDRREYALALSTVDRFLGQNPRSAEGIEIKRTALYQQGKLLSDQQKLTESYALLNQLVKLSPKDQESMNLFTNVKSRLVQDHYNQGIRYFREEKLEAAINEWRAVLQYDANHEGAKKNINQAERVLRGLQQRQQKKTAG
jgi:tetratricopeptide (TPR) repeat protein